MTRMTLESSKPRPFLTPGGIPLARRERRVTDKTCIIVVEIGGSTGQIQIGIVVDSVSEVMNIKGDDVEDPPSFGTGQETEFILGMAKVENGVKILLDIDRVLSQAEIVSLEEAA